MKSKCDISPPVVPVSTSYLTTVLLGSRLPPFPSIPVIAPTVQISLPSNVVGSIYGVSNLESYLRTL